MHCYAASQDVQSIDVADLAAEQHEVATLLGSGLHVCIQVYTCHHKYLKTVSLTCFEVSLSHGTSAPEQLAKWKAVVYSSRDYV